MKQPIYSVYLETQSSLPAHISGPHIQHRIDERERTFGAAKCFSVTSWTELEEAWMRIADTLTDNFKLYLTLPLFPVGGFGDFERGKFFLNSDSNKDAQKVHAECSCFLSRCKELSDSPLGKMVITFHSLEHKMLEFFAQCVMKNRTDFGILCIAAVFSSVSVELIFSLEYEEDLLSKFTEWVIGHFECSIEYCCHFSDVLSYPEKQITVLNDEKLDVSGSNAEAKVHLQQFHDEYTYSSELSDFSDDDDSLNHSRNNTHTLLPVTKSSPAPRPRHENKSVSKNVSKDIKKPHGNCSTRKEKVASKKENVEPSFDSGDIHMRKKTLDTKSLPRVALWEILICLAVLVLSMVFFMSFHRKS